MRALIGHTGFVGSTLLTQTSFDKLYNSKNINEIENEEFDEIYCAGISAVKYLANQKPDEDLAKIEILKNALTKVKCKRFILISTVDVFSKPFNVNENTKIEIDEKNYYGKHRFFFEEFVKENFNNHLIVRLPGLVGENLKKNILFDFKYHNQIEKIESRNVFQFYPMQNLYKDIQISLNNNLSLIHLTSEPLQVSEIARACFDLDFKNEISQNLIKYDFQTVYGGLWHKENYQYSKEQVLEVIKDYAKA